MPIVAERHHRAARIEDAVTAAVGRALRPRGWQPRVIGYPGYGREGDGDTGWVRVMARVLLSPPSAATPPSQPETPPRGWRAFVTTPVPGAEVVVDVAGREHQVVTDRSGYVDVRLPADLQPGWHEVRVTAEPSTTYVPVRVVGADVTEGVVSDIDDTVMVTRLPRPLIAAWNTFVLREHARRPVPGMADLLTAAQEAHPDAPVIYLSTGAWNVAPTLQRFLASHGYPAGPLLLTDWGPTPHGWFRSGSAHKRSSLRRLIEELPRVRWLLVGDDGQHDPVIYGDVAEERPDRVRAIAIRQLTAAEQVLATGSPTVTDPRAHPEGVPWVEAPDGHGLLAALRSGGLV